MHQSETWQTLLMACEARDIGRPVEAEQLFAEAAPDFEYKRRSARALEAPTFFVDEGPDEYDHEDWEPLPLVQQRQAHVAECRAIDWLKWRREYRPVVDLTAFDAMMREMFPAERLAEMAAQRDPFVASPTPDADGIEVRIRSYANLIKPRWFGVFSDANGVEREVP